MNITVNGHSHEVEASTTLAQVLEQQNFPTSGVAVALNGSVVPRTSWADTPLPAEAAVEVLTAVQGG
ncbi:sulfur carrier protein ThiS [Klebsiella pneumoniae]|nr:sulfur carrier protein ThiS [Klebsiella pneumoniae]